MKTKILLSFCCVLAIASFAQDSTFQIKNYKYRIPGFRALEFSTSFGGNISKSKQGSSETQKNQSFQLLPSSIRYTRIFSTDRRFHTSSTSLYPSFFSETEGNGLQESKGRNGQASFYWQFDDRFYRRNNWFLHLKNNLFAKGDFTKQKSSQYTIKTNIKGFDDDLSVGFGKGRIEIVQDAQMALYILNDLSLQGLIDKTPDVETINQFAQLITELNNKRVFDSRRRRIYQLTQIDKFLREKEITQVPDIRHFTTINDNWFFAFNPERYSGSDWYFDIRSSVELGDANQTNKNANYSLNTENESDYKNWGIGPKAGYENYKPINLKWQRNLGAHASWQTRREETKNKNTMNGTTTGNKVELKQQETELSMFYGIGFYPNNRTRLNATIDLDLIQTKFLDNPLDKKTSILPSLLLSTDYFLGYRTRLIASLSMDYRYYRWRYSAAPSTDQHAFNTNFSVGLSHFFL
jgi:hypothetical protein